MPWVVGDRIPQTACSRRKFVINRPAISSLRQRLLAQYREPFDRVLDTAQARAELGDYDRVLMLSQLIGPIVFTKISGVGHIGPRECARLVDDFLTARRAERREG